MLLTKYSLSRLSNYTLALVSLERYFRLRSTIHFKVLEHHFVKIGMAVVSVSVIPSFLVLPISDYRREDFSTLMKVITTLDTVFFCVTVISLITTYRLMKTWSLRDVKDMRKNKAA